jgi:DNA-binding XRE family transcriptional regulator
MTGPKRSNRTLARQVGATLESLRHERRLRQYMLADMAGVTKGMLSAYELGKQCPSVGAADLARRCGRAGGSSGAAVVPFGGVTPTAAGGQVGRRPCA